MLLEPRAYRGEPGFSGARLRGDRAGSSPGGALWPGGLWNVVPLTFLGFSWGKGLLGGAGACWRGREQVSLQGGAGLWPGGAGLWPSAVLTNQHSGPGQGTCTPWTVQLGARRVPALC